MRTSSAETLPPFRSRAATVSHVITKERMTWFVDMITVSRSLARVYYAQLCLKCVMQNLPFERKTFVPCNLAFLWGYLIVLEQLDGGRTSFFVIGQQILA